MMVILLYSSIHNSVIHEINSFIHSECFYCASSSPLLLRGASDYSIDKYCVGFNTSKATVSEGLAQGPYVAARVVFQPATLRTQGTPNLPLRHHVPQEMR